MKKHNSEIIGMDLLTRKESEILFLKERIKELEAELKITNFLLEERTQLLKSIPSCEAHGNECVPHAKEWIAKVKTLAKVIAGNSNEN